MIKAKYFFYAALITALFMIGACVKAPTEGGDNPNVQNKDDGKVKIGFSMATLKEERWQKDKEEFETYCKEKQV